MLNKNFERGFSSTTTDKFLVLPIKFSIKLLNFQLHFVLCSLCNGEISCLFYRSHSTGRSNRQRLFPRVSSEWIHRKLFLLRLLIFLLLPLWVIFFAFFLILDWKQLLYVRRWSYKVLKRNWPPQCHSKLSFLPITVTARRDKVFCRYEQWT